MTSSDQNNKKKITLELEEMLQTILQAKEDHSRQKTRCTQMSEEY